MCGVDRMTRLGPLVYAITMLVLAQAVPSSGQTSFGGSFDGGGATTPPPQTQTAQPAQPGGFGGSFDSPAPGEPDDQTNAAPAPVDHGFPDGDATGAQPDVSIAEQILAFETRDFGVPQSSTLKSGRMHGPTPTAVPGAGVVSTAKLAKVIAAGDAFVLIDVLDGDYSLPDAYIAPKLAEPGHFGDRLQSQAADWLAQITNGDPETAIVIYCSDPHCWLSYNAALRAVAAGYTHVYWYRGGMRAWQMAGLRVFPSGF